MISIERLYFLRTNYQIKVSWYENISKIVVGIKNGNNNMQLFSKQVKSPPYNQKEDTAELRVTFRRVWPTENCAVLTSDLSPSISIVNVGPNSRLLLLTCRTSFCACMTTTRKEWWITLLCAELMKRCIITLLQARSFLFFYNTTDVACTRLCGGLCAWEMHRKSANGNGKFKFSLSLNCETETEKFTGTHLNWCDCCEYTYTTCCMQHMQLHGISGKAFALF